MTDNDYNIIKPVDGLQNIIGLAPVKHREERKRRQQGQDSAAAKLRPAGQETSDGEPNESVDSGNGIGEFTDNEGDQHSIDYCA
jgi:hypothetical protein